MVFVVDELVPLTRKPNILVTVPVAPAVTFCCEINPTSAVTLFVFDAPIVGEDMNHLTFVKLPVPVPFTVGLAAKVFIAPCAEVVLL